MSGKLTVRQLQIQILAFWQRRNQKQIGAAAGMSASRVSRYLTCGQEIKDPVYERLLAAIPCPPAALPTVTGCLEALEALEDDASGLTPEERAEVEKGVAAVTHRMRETLIEAVRLSRQPPPEGFPEAAQADLDRERAEGLWERLKELPEETWPDVVRTARVFQSWALCERLCEESALETSRQVARAISLAKLAEHVAEQVPGPDAWRDRLRGYAGAHTANLLRALGNLSAAEAAFEAAKCLWQSGSDPAGLLDPGRLPDLESSLRRDQRRFDEALALLNEAFALSRSPALVLIKKAFLLEMMREYERTAETLRQAKLLLEREGRHRLENLVRCNLGFVLCHLDRFAEAADLANEVLNFAAGVADEVLLLRGIWLKGRTAAGLGQSEEAQTFLRHARQELALGGMDYDVALALVEEAALLLNEGRKTETKILVRELTPVFESREVHPEARAALRLFQQAAGQEEATAGLAHRLLRYLFRARYDPDLRFES